MLALLLALAALLSTGHVDDGFGHGIMAHCTAVVDVGRFVGCEDRRALPDDDAAYAGLVWRGDSVRLDTGT